ncbi:MAG: tetratricopeptide repeat protein [Caldilineaceae bacterium]|nr:tetratricopeptide repeat protein [Caldilineaceae bacterium]MBP8110351.1 tetratricopeptide repeat protein [Caldilineaceae bacterium]MBP9073663.1 tetratricopeptide repeat protein [Caldilineaceae bacterium]
MTTPTRRHLADAAFTALVLTVGAQLGPTILGSLALNMGANWAADQTWPWWTRLRDGLSKPDTPGGSDLRAALVEATEIAIQRLETGWQQTPRGNQVTLAGGANADAAHGLFTMLTEDAASFFQPDHLRAQIRAKADPADMAQPDALADHLTPYLKGHDPQLVAYVQENITSALVYWWGQTLNHSPEAQAEFVRLSLGGLSADHDKIQAAIEKLTAIATAAFERMNAGPPTAPAVPLQRPPLPHHFTGRADELAWLTATVQPGRVTTLIGPGGMGKSALAAHFMGQLFPEGMAPSPTGPHPFPDGLLFHTFYNEPDPDMAFEQIARSLGEDPRPSPESAARRALANRKLLLLLDGTEACPDLDRVLRVRGNCGVLITTRQLSDAPDPAHSRTLSPLPGPDATALVEAWIQGRAVESEVESEPDAATAIAQIAEWVGRLPLALRLAGHYMKSYGESPADYLAWLNSEGLAALDHGDHRRESVPVLLGRSVAAAGEQARHLLAIFGLLALAPVDRETLAAALDLPPAALRHDLKHLVDLGLCLTENGRTQPSHALVHTYARTRLIPPEDGVARLAEYFTALAKRESDRGLPGYRRLDQDRVHILAVLESCEAKQAWAAANDLAEVVQNYLGIQGRCIDRVTVLQVGMHAAQSLKRPFDEGRHLNHLGLANATLGQVEQAIKQFDQSLAICRKIGDRQGESNCLGNLGVTYYSLGQAVRAIEYHDHALAISREIGDRRGEGNHLGNLGLVYYSLGQMKLAREKFEQALTISQEIHDRQGEGNRLGNLGLVYFSLGEIKRAIDYHGRALAISREIGYRGGEGMDLGNLGLAYAALGQVERAIEQYDQALTISREIGDLRSEGIWRANLGDAYKNLDQIDKALSHLQAALIIFEEIRSPHAETVRGRLADLP